MTMGGRGGGNTRIIFSSENLGTFLLLGLAASRYDRWAGSNSLWVDPVLEGFKIVFLSQLKKHLKNECWLVFPRVSGLPVQVGNGSV